MQFVADMRGLGSGPAASRLIDSGFDPAVLRPWAPTDTKGKRIPGRGYVSIPERDSNGTPVVRNSKPVISNIPVTNAPALLRREDWLKIDEAVTFAAKERLRFWAAVYGRNPYVIPNGMGTIAVQHAVAVGDASASIAMDPIRRGERTRPVLDVAQIPLPVTFSDGSFTAREIAVSQNGGMPLDTVAPQLSTRKVSEEVEKMTLGISSSYTYAGGTVYGALNFPQRFTKVLTAPTGTNGAVTLAELLDMIKTLQDNFFYGPYVAFYSRDWNPYFALDYATAYPRSLMERLRVGLPEISEWVQVDYLTGKQIVLIQMTPDVIQGMNGMNITTVQWDEEGGFEWRFKVLCIYVPRVRSNGNGDAGIIHGSVP